VEHVLIDVTGVTGLSNRPRSTLQPGGWRTY
jgi:hypothetical protein